MTIPTLGPVAPTAGAISALRPLPLTAFRPAGGFWADRMRINRERSLLHGYAQLEAAGNFHNFELAAGTTSGPYRALGMMFSAPYPFLDSDVYKWLEAMGWELGREDSPELREAADRAIDVVQRAQRSDGYVNTFVQVLAGGRTYEDLPWGHELYTLGHLVQAAIAWQRALGDERLMQVGLAAVGSVQRELGGQSDRLFFDGHPEIEMALVELYRTTGDRSHLELAARMIDGRGHGAVGPGRFGPTYWQDHQPVREARYVTGHAVRQLYLDCGAVDVAVETGDRGLLHAVLERWQEMIATRTYLTGGVGSRHTDESFGDPYELPPDRAYTESCAAIASVMLSWRLLLATGESRFADAMERALYNAVLPGIAEDGTHFFYVNPLQRRTVQVSAGDNEERRVWYPCACCPPNLMRTLATWPYYAATADDAGVQIQQYGSGELTADERFGTVRIAMETDYPWSGKVDLKVLDAPAQGVGIVLRQPSWCRSAVVTPTGDARRTWHVGDAFRLDLDMPVRVTLPDERIDAIRGCAAVERGPLVYCLEQADLPSGALVEDVVIDIDVEPKLVDASQAANLGIRARGAHRGRSTQSAWPYGDQLNGDEDTPIELDLVPYFSWANRGPGGMRIWIPIASRSAERPRA